MRKFILAAVVALPLAALGQQRAMAGGGGDCCTPLYRIGMSVGLVFRGWCGCDYSCCKQSIGHCHGGKCGGGGGGCSFPGGGPWYGAWPYPAHFQTPAPTGYPYWPAPMTYGAAAPAPQMGNPYAASGNNMGMGMGMEGYGNAAMMMPAGGSYGGYPMNVAAIQPAAYYPQAPAYWYPR